MIDPIHSLAFAVQANPGVYAVLVGSGVSRGGNIPTGWDITLDLVSKVAALHKESCDPDPAAWYEERFGTDLLEGDCLVMSRLDGMKERRLPLNDWMYGVIRAISKDVIPDDSRFEYVFDKLEMLISLAFIYHGKRDEWTPPGAYGYRRGIAGRILKEIGGITANRRRELAICCGWGVREELGRMCQ